MCKIFTKANFVPLNCIKVEVESRRKWKYSSYVFTCSCFPPLLYQSTFQCFKPLQSAAVSPLAEVSGMHSLQPHILKPLLSIATCIHITTFISFNIKLFSSCYTRLSPLLWFQYTECLYCVPVFISYLCDVKLFNMLFFCECLFWHCMSFTI